MFSRCSQDVLMGLVGPVGSGGSRGSAWLECAWVWLLWGAKLG